jgi:hypothetical protein
MRNFFAAMLTLSVSFFVAAAAFSAPAKAQASAGNAKHQPVVVELFTSEGCSTCPPADALLQQLQAQQPFAGIEIIPVEEHVDYWNHDGWVDPYSSAEWTERQQTYVALIKKDEYTPEMVIDGQGQFVGNDPRQAEAEIERAAQGAKTEVAIVPAERQERAPQRFHVSVGKMAPDAKGDVAEVWLAVTEDGLHSDVRSGENSGHVLHHVATLRWLHKIGTADANGAPASFSADTAVKLNSHWNLENVHVVVFVQNRKGRQILGAASTKLRE